MGTMEQKIDRDVIISAMRERKSVVKNKFKAEVLGIFGSYARGEQQSGSSVDVLVRFDEDANLLNIVALSNYLEKVIGAPVDIAPEETLDLTIHGNIMDELVTV